MATVGQSIASDTIVNIAADLDSGPLAANSQYVLQNHGLRTLQTF